MSKLKKYPKEKTKLILVVEVVVNYLNKVYVIAKVHWLRVN